MSSMNGASNPGPSNDYEEEFPSLPSGNNQTNTHSKNIASFTKNIVTEVSLIIKNSSSLDYRDPHIRTKRG